MASKSITFLSSRGRGMSNEMALVKAHLMKCNDDGELNFRYFVKNVASKNVLASVGLTRARNRFCAEITNAICVDPSLPAKKGGMSEEGVKLLMAVPYEYMLKNAPLMEKAPNTVSYKTMKNFTHIIAGSPFVAKLLKSIYNLEEVELIEGINLPFTWEICQKENQDEIREEIAFFYPAVKEKKVMAILSYGIMNSKKVPFDNVNLQKLLDDLGKDWIVITNSNELMEQSYSLSSEYKDSFAYMNRVLPTENLLYIADVLVTNNGRMASAFAARKKPVFCPLYKNNYFEKFMSSYYPGLYVKNLNALPKMSLESENVSDENKKFWEEFAYPLDKEPYETICQILK